MINRVILVGRLTRDPMLRKTQSGLSVATFTVACDRRFSGGNGQDRQTDFISCVAWRQSADFLGQYAHKGALVGVDGRIQTRNYDNASGQKVYVTEVVCDSVQLLESKSASENRSATMAISRRMLAMLRRTRSGTLRRTMDSMISALARHWIFPAMTYHFN